MSTGKRQGRLAMNRERRERTLKAEAEAKRKSKGKHVTVYLDGDLMLFLTDIAKLSGVSTDGVIGVLMAREVLKEGWKKHV